MMICNICSKDIRNNDIVTIISSPVKIVSNNGDYYLDDFYRNQQVLHIDCYNNREVGFENILDELWLTLVSLGVKANLLKVKEFVENNKNIAKDRLLVEYFLQKHD